VNHPVNNTQGGDSRLGQSSESPELPH